MAKFISQNGVKGGKNNRMDNFLHKVARRILDEQGDKTGDTLVVFNNQRAGLFLQDQFAKLGGNPFFLPHIKVIDELVSQMSQMTIAPHEFLLFELYDIHRRMDEANPRYSTFEEFMSVGEMMIGDFSEIDLYCVDAEKLFNNIHDERKLGIWELTGEPLTESQLNYLHFYQSLNSYYQQLRKRLAESNMAYTGMAYRHVAENIETLASRADYSHIYFVGFNALSVSESRIIDHFIAEGKGTLVCDGDEYYFGDDSQEAGHFLRLNAKKYPGNSHFDNNFAGDGEEKEIYIVNCPENALQAKAAGTIVEELLGGDNKESLQDLAIVLGDEHLIIPVLNSLPASAHTTNVTMGLPFIMTRTHILADHIIALYCNRHNNKFSHSDIVAVLSDPFFNRLHNRDDIQHRITSIINRDKVIYASGEEIAAMTAGIGGLEKLSFLFAESDTSPSEVLSIILRTAQLIVSEGLTDAKDNKENEALACLVQTVDYLTTLQEKYNYIDKVETLRNIYQRLAQRRTVTFIGKPLKGIQVLGMLETRSLDFPKVIVTSVNEGTIPGGWSNNSLIPLTLKRGFKLPTFAEKDAVYAYNFFRLLQRAKQAWLIYSSDTEGMGKGEPSRFIMQIREELAKRHPNVKVKSVVVTTPNTTADSATEPPIAKSQKALDKLRDRAREGFSPSALNRYRSCPMQFYYSDIMDVGKVEEVNEDVENNELGTFIHNLLCDIYNRDEDHHIRPQTLKQALAETEQNIASQFKKEVLKGRNVDGRNYLYQEVAKMQVTNFLQMEIDQLRDGHSIVIRLTEDSMQEPLTPTLPGIDYPVTIKGTADRIDLFDGELRIADYKSGSVQEKELKAKDGDDPHKIPDKWFQVMTYAWLYCRKHKYTGQFRSGIIPLRSIGTGFMPAQWNGSDLLGAKDIDNFETMLSELTGEILDPNTPFTATPRDEYTCKHCPVARSCRNRKE